MSPAPPPLLGIEAALAEAERAGFRLAVIGRTGALAAIATFYLAAAYFPSNLKIAIPILASAGVGLALLASSGTRYQRLGRYACFALDAATVSAVLAFAPLSSGGDVPQNLVFFSSRTEYYYLILSLSVLALSPALVLWTGISAVVGLGMATAWIMAGMEHVVSYRDLPPGPSREEYLAVVLNPDFLNLGFRANEAIVLLLVTGIAALAVHRARTMVPRLLFRLGECHGGDRASQGCVCPARNRRRTAAGGHAALAADQ